MTRTLFNARLHLFALLLVWAAWMFITGLLGGQLIGRPPGLAQFESWFAAAFSLLVTAIAWAGVNSRLPELARRGELWAVRVVGVFAAIAVAALVLGVVAHDPEALSGWALGSVAPYNLLGIRVALGIVGLFLLVLAPAGDAAPEPYFLTNRDHASDGIARRSLVAAAGQTLLLVLAGDLALRFQHAYPDTAVFSRTLRLAAIAYVVGIVVCLWQRYPQRAVGMLPLGGTIAIVAAFAAMIAPSAEWPILLLLFTIGLGHTPPRNDFLASVAPSQRFSGLLIMALAQLAGAALAIEIVALISTDSMARVACFAIVLVVTAAAIYGYIRELIESLLELILMVTNPIRGYGPGLKVLPTRGPMLVLANHCSWFDPLWLAKLIPVRMRPMMTSRFFDLPMISWLMRGPFRAIRVVDAGYRRETPEIQEVIAALDAGETVLIFPEGWLRRREDRPLRRFGQGIYQILREMPRTPVVACWIEGSWGSYTSFWNGPPTVNKKPDILRRIRIGVSEPQVLSIEMLHDQLQTRRYLMKLCLHARTYIGLPELPAPHFALDEDAEEAPAQ